MRPLNSALIAAALLVAAAPSFAQYRPNPPATFPSNGPSTSPSTNPGNGQMASGQHPLWGIVGEVVRTIVERTVPHPHPSQQPGGPVSGTNPQPPRSPQGTSAPQPAPQPRTANAAPQLRQPQPVAPQPCGGCDAGPRG